MKESSAGMWLEKEEEIEMNREIERVKGVVESIEGERGVGELNGKTREERRERS